MQSHITLSEEIDIRFNSETKLTIHRELVHMGSLTKVNSGKELMAFLCNDILLLTTATRDIGKVSNLFASEKAMNTMYKVYKRPFFLDEIDIVTTSPCPPAEKSYQLQQSSSNSSSSSPSSLTDQDQSVFEIWIGKKSQTTNSRKLISFRAIHANDKLYWLQKLTKSIRFYHENVHRIVRQDVRRSSVASHTARLLVTVSEAQNMKFRHSSVQHFFVASVGSPGDLQSDHPQIESSAARPVTREARASLAFDSLESLTGSVKFEQALRFLLSDEDIHSHSLIVSLYERTPFTPDLLLGMCHLSIAQVQQNLKKTTGRPLTFTLSLSSQHRNTIGDNRSSNHESANSTKVVVRVDLM